MLYLKHFILVNWRQYPFNVFVLINFIVDNLFHIGYWWESKRRPRRRWVDNIKMDLRKVGWDGRDWIDLAQDRDRWRALVNTVMNLRVP
jgi:hypothetical protein